MDVQFDGEELNQANVFQQLQYFLYELLALKIDKGSQVQLIEERDLIMSKIESCIERFLDRIEVSQLKSYYYIQQVIHQGTANVVRFILSYISNEQIKSCEQQTDEVQEIDSWTITDAEEITKTERKMFKNQLIMYNYSAELKQKHSMLSKSKQQQKEKTNQQQIIPGLKQGEIFKKLMSGSLALNQSKLFNRRRSHLSELQKSQKEQKIVYLSPKNQKYKSSKTLNMQSRQTSENETNVFYFSDEESKNQNNEQSQIQNTLDSTQESIKYNFRNADFQNVMLSRKQFEMKIYSQNERVKIQSLDTSFESYITRSSSLLNLKSSKSEKEGLIQSQNIGRLLVLLYVVVAVLTVYLFRLV